MINKKVYIVIKDIEGLSEGDEIEELGNIYFCFLKFIGFYRKDVENNSEYFKLKDRFYTEEDMRNCFNASRSPVNKKTFEPIFMKYEDYIKSINK